jgi:FMN phosphatase YigB (HAD superfamily)
VAAPSAVTIDAFGTLVELRDPVPALAAALERYGVDADPPSIFRAFRAEVEYYVPRSHTGRDAPTLAALRVESARVFLSALGVSLDAREFAPAFVGALEFELVPQAREACDALTRRHVPVAVVSNWDIGLREHLGRLELDLPVVTSADAGMPKPDPAIFLLALERLGASATDAVHIGDSAADEEGARAAGMRFEPAPLADAVRRIL